MCYHKDMKKTDRRKLQKGVYTAAQWTWGLPQTMIGAALFLAHRKDKHFDYNGARATVWDKDTGVSLGKFIFVPGKKNAGSKDNADKLADPFLLEHEYGHTLQSLILGPFYLLFIGAPSILWNRLPFFQHKRKRTGKSYYSAPFESSANRLAARASRRHRH